jgi:hypothetical protein
MGRAWGGRDDDRLIVDPIRGWDVMLAGVGRMGRHTLQKYWLVCFCWGALALEVGSFAESCQFSGRFQA